MALHSERAPEDDIVGFAIDVLSHSHSHADDPAPFPPTAEDEIGMHQRPSSSSPLSKGVRGKEGKRSALHGVWPRPEDQEEALGGGAADVLSLIPATAPPPPLPPAPCATPSWTAVLFSQSTHSASSTEEEFPIDLRAEVSELVAQTMGCISHEAPAVPSNVSAGENTTTPLLNRWLDLSARAPVCAETKRQAVYVPPVYPSDSVKRSKTISRPEHSDRLGADNEEPGESAPAVVDSLAASIVLPKGGVDSLLQDLNLANVEPEPVTLENQLQLALRKLGLIVSDTDPSALRSEIRKAMEQKQKELVAPLVGLHIVKVLDALAQDPEFRKSFVEYCLDPTTGYCAALQGEWEKPVRDLLVLSAQTAKKQNAEVPVSKQSPSAKLPLVETTIAVDQSQVCSDASLRKVVAFLEQDLSVRVIERNLGVSLLLDGKTACAYMALSNDFSAAVVQSMTNGLAKWLACEAHRLDSVWLVFSLDTKANAIVRTAVRSVASAVALLVPPAPKVIMRLTTSPSHAARMIRAACDEMGARDYDWYSARNDFASNLDPRLAAAVHFVAEFPGMTALTAESIVVREGIAPSQLLLGSDVPPFVNTWTGPQVGVGTGIVNGEEDEDEDQDRYEKYWKRSLVVGEPRPGMKKGDQQKLTWSS